MLNPEVSKEAENRLQNIFNIKFQLSEDEDFQTKKYQLLSSLLYVYDQAWHVEGMQCLIGSTKAPKDREGNSSSECKEDEKMKMKKASVQLKSLLTRAGLGHLLPTGTALLGGGEVGKLHCLKITNTLMDKCEQRHGAKLTTIIRQITLKNNRQQSRSSGNKKAGPATLMLHSSNPDKESFSSLSSQSEVEDNKTPVKDNFDLGEYNMEAFPVPKRELPRTPLHSQENCQAIEEAHAPPIIKNIIPTGYQLSRTPYIAPSKEGSSSFENSPITTPEIVLTQRIDISVEDFSQVKPSSVRSPSFFIVQESKIAKPELCKSPEIDFNKTTETEMSESVTSLTVTKNVIPTGSQLPRTPYVPPLPQEEHDDSLPVPSKRLFATPAPSNEEIENKKNKIPLGPQIPRTPFLKGDVEVEQHSCLNLSPAKPYSDSAKNSSAIDKTADFTLQCNQNLTKQEINCAEINPSSSPRCSTIEHVRPTVTLDEQTPHVDCGASAAVDDIPTAVTKELSTAVVHDDRQELDLNRDVDSMQAPVKNPSLSALFQQQSGSFTNSDTAADIVTTANPEASMLNVSASTNSDFNITNKTLDVSKNKKQATKRTKMTAKAADGPSSEPEHTNDEIKSAPSPQKQPRQSLSTTISDHDVPKLNQVKTVTPALEVSKKLNPPGTKRTRKVAEEAPDLALKKQSVCRLTVHPRNARTTSNADFQELSSTNESSSTIKTKALEVTKSRQPMSKRSRQAVNLPDDISVLSVEDKNESAPSPQKKPRESRNTKINNDVSLEASECNDSEKIICIEKSKPEIITESISNNDDLANTIAGTKSVDDKLGLSKSSENTNALVKKPARGGRAKNMGVTLNETATSNSAGVADTSQTGANIGKKDLKSINGEMTAAYVEKLDLDHTAVVKKPSGRGRGKNSKVSLVETDSTVTLDTVADKIKVGSKSINVEVITAAGEKSEVARNSQNLTVAKKPSGRGRAKKTETSINSTSTTLSSNATDTSQTIASIIKEDHAEQLEVAKSCQNTTVVKKSAGRARGKGTNATLIERDTMSASNLTFTKNTSQTLMDDANLASVEQMALTVADKNLSSEEVAQIEKKPVGRGRKKTTLKETDSKILPDTSVNNLKFAGEEQAVTENLDVTTEKKVATRGRKKPTNSFNIEANITSASNISGRTSRQSRKDLDVVMKASIDDQSVPNKTLQDASQIEAKIFSKGSKKCVDHLSGRHTKDSEPESTPSNEDVTTDRRGRKKNTTAITAVGSNTSTRTSRHSKMDLESAVVTQEDADVSKSSNTSATRTTARGLKKNNPSNLVESTTTKASVAAVTLKTTTRRKIANQSAVSNESTVIDKATEKEVATVEKQEVKKVGRGHTKNSASKSADKIVTSNTELMADLSSDAANIAKQTEPDLSSEIVTNRASKNKISVLDAASSAVVLDSVKTKAQRGRRSPIPEPEIVMDDPSTSRLNDKSTAKEPLKRGRSKNITSGTLKEAKLKSNSDSIEAVSVTLTRRGQPDLKNSLTSKAQSELSDKSKKRTKVETEKQKSLDKVSKELPEPLKSMSEEASANEAVLISNESVHTPSCQSASVDEPVLEAARKKPVEVEPKKKPIKAGSRRKVKPDLDGTVCESVDPMPIAQDLNLVRRLPDDVYQTPKRKKATTAAATNGQIKVLANGSKKNRKAPNISTPEMAKLPKLKKIEDEIMSSAYTGANSTNKGDGLTHTALLQTLCDDMYQTPMVRVRKPRAKK